jgi:hypothetical protein
MKPHAGFLSLASLPCLFVLPQIVVGQEQADRRASDQLKAGVVLEAPTRGFMYGGASSVVSSLWKVEDFATAQLMSTFHGFMEKQWMRPAAALRAAQLELWSGKRWSSPYNWAGFTIQGDWK